MTHNFRVLVVDDEASIRKRCVRLLSRQGYHVVGASSSSAALALIKKEGAWFDILRFKKKPTNTTCYKCER